MMAAPLTARACQQIHKFSQLSRTVTTLTSYGCRKCSSASNDKRESGDGRQDVGRLFTNPDVQSILKQVTGFKLDKIFKTQHGQSEPPKYRLLTDKQFKELQDDAIRRGMKQLQMPPVLDSWSDESEILSEDPEIANWDPSGCDYVFTDISFGVPRLERICVIRETNGTLRTANAAEQDRMVNIYFPREGRMYNTPDMFQDENLELLLSNKKYQYILDRACLQFEPDDPMYVKVTNQTYEYIDANGHYDELWSTRHFGVMAFYLVRNKKIDGLLAEQLQRNRLEDAAATVRLYSIIHPDSQTAQKLQQQTSQDPISTVQVFMNEDAKQLGKIELALQVLKAGDAVEGSAMTGS